MTDRGAVDLVIAACKRVLARDWAYTWSVPMNGSVAITWLLEELRREPAAPLDDAEPLVKNDISFDGPHGDGSERPKAAYIAGCRRAIGAEDGFVILCGKPTPCAEHGGEQLAPVPRGHCGRCDRCGGILFAPCLANECTAPSDPPRATCAGCGAPYQEEARCKVGNPPWDNLMCGNPLPCPLHPQQAPITMAGATELRTAADPLKVTLSKAAAPEPGDIAFGPELASKELAQETDRNGVPRVLMAFGDPPAIVHRVNNWPALHAAYVARGAEVEAAQRLAAARGIQRDDALVRAEAAEARARELETQQTSITVACGCEYGRKFNGGNPGWYQVEQCHLHNEDDTTAPASQVAKLALRGDALKAVREWRESLIGIGAVDHGVPTRVLKSATVLDADALMPLLRCLKKESHLGLWDMVPAEWQTLVGP